MPSLLAVSYTQLDVYKRQLLYYSGIRFGEFLALTPKDFDFENNTLDISKSLQRIKRQDVITPPKTPKSIRNIIIPDFVMEEVKDYMSKLYNLKDTDRVFPVSYTHLDVYKRQLLANSDTLIFDRIHNIFICSDTFIMVPLSKINFTISSINFVF